MIESPKSVSVVVAVVAAAVVVVVVAAVVVVLFVMSLFTLFTVYETVIIFMLHSNQTLKLNLAPHLLLPLHT